MRGVDEAESDGEESLADAQISLIPLHQNWREVFNRYDQNQDGKISFWELSKVIKNGTFKNDCPKEIVNLILGLAKENQNSSLTCDEFGSMIHWLGIFNTYDTNRDGKISLSELQGIIRSESYSNDIPQETVAEIMERADQDNNGYLSFQEFVRLNYWLDIFHKYDIDGSGEISIRELRTALKSDFFTHDIPKETVLQIMDRADEDRNCYLNFHEFVKMINNPENKATFGHLLGHVEALGKDFVRFVVGRKPSSRGEDQTDAGGDDEEKYSCQPPKLIMLFLSLLEISTYVNDLINTGNTMAKGPVALVLIYDPHRRYEVWRYLTYMFVHNGSLHLIGNLLVQILLGIPLEMVNNGWRVVLVYTAGVVAGSLGTSIVHPTKRIAGASGGVYALITAHIATVIINWKEKKFGIYRLLFFLAFAVLKVGTEIYNRYALDTNNKDGWSVHLCGALGGLLVGISVLRNLDVKSWEKKLAWVSLTTYVLLVLVAVIWNAAFPSFFPDPT